MVAKRGLLFLLVIGVPAQAAGQSDFGFQKRVILSLAFPLGNGYSVTGSKDQKFVYGFLGLSGEIGLSYKKKAYFLLKSGGVLSWEYPFPVPVDHYGTYERANAAFVSLMKFQPVMFLFRRRVEFGYGVQYSHLGYERHTTLSLFPVYQDLVDISIRKDAIGLAAMVKYNVLPRWSVGVAYFPSFYTVSNGKFEYNHVGFVEIAWQIIRWKRN